MSLPSDLFERQWLFALNLGLSHQDQLKLIDLALREGGETGPHPVTKEMMWTGYLLRTVPISLAPPEFQNEYYGRWTYLARLEREFDWRWANELGEQIVGGFLAQFPGLYTHLTRVNLLVQRPGFPLVAHRDLRGGEIYPDLKRPEVNALGPSRLRYTGESWYTAAAEKRLDGIHAKQKYLTLKLPISERTNSPGRPFLVCNGRKFAYDSKGKAFFINEAQMLHGAEPVSFHRGVIFIDGILNLEAVAALDKKSVELDEL